MSIVSVFAVMLLTMLLGMVMNVGRQVDGKIRMQNSADAAAYSGTVVLARGMNTLAFTNHLLSDVFALTAFMREARDRNAQSFTPDVLAAWNNVAGMFAGSGFPKFRALGTAISAKVPMERALVNSYSDWANAASDRVLPLLEEILAEELIPKYQRAVVLTTPDIAQAATMEIALRNGRPDHGRGDMLGVLWRASGQPVGGDYELTDPTLPVVDPQWDTMPDQSRYVARARRQRRTLAQVYLTRWNNQAMNFFDHEGKMSQFGRLWRAFTCGQLDHLLETEYPHTNLPYQIRSRGCPTCDPNGYLERNFTFLGVVYWGKLPEMMPGVFENPLDSDTVAFAEVRMFVPRPRLVWQWRCPGCSSSVYVGGVPGDFQALTPPEEEEPGGDGFWVVGRQQVPTHWDLLNQHWTCQLVPATQSTLPEILQTPPPLPGLAGEGSDGIIVPNLGDLGPEDIRRISPH
ncbi:MAG: Tad domain-containing protein [Pirellulales bacterium]|nr:Tad domain-containing protein [Pirellulales bacterium]